MQTSCAPDIVLSIFPDITNVFLTISLWVRDCSYSGYADEETETNKRLSDLPRNESEEMTVGETKWGGERRKPGVWRSWLWKWGSESEWNRGLSKAVVGAKGRSEGRESPAAAPRWSSFWRQLKLDSAEFCWLSTCEGLCGSRLLCRFWKTSRVS